MLAGGQGMILTSLSSVVLPSSRPSTPGQSCGVCAPLWLRHFRCQIKEVPLPLPCSCFDPSDALTFLRNSNTSFKNGKPLPLGSRRDGREGNGSSGEGVGEPDMAEGGQGQVTFISNRPTQLMCGFFFFL